MPPFSVKVLKMICDKDGRYANLQLSKEIQVDLLQLNDKERCEYLSIWTLLCCSPSVMKECISELDRLTD